jgi:hypothetical protein
MPLATAGINGRTQAMISMSRSVSLTIQSSNETVLSLNNLPQPIEIQIPRDTNLLIPPMTLQNVTGLIMLTGANNNRQFALYYVNVTSPTESLTLAAIFEFKSANPSLGFLVIYRFDAIPIFNSTINQKDGYKIFCPTG